MKKYILLIGFLAVYLVGCPVAAQTTGTRSNRAYVGEEVVVKKQVKRCTIDCGCNTPIRVAGFVTNPPFGWVDVDTTVSSDKKTAYKNDGLGYHLFEQLAKELGYRVQNVGFRSYAAALKALKRGQVDVIAGVYFDKRMLGDGTSILYPSFFKNFVIVAFMKGKEKKVNSFDDLKGLKGVARQEEGLYSLIYQVLPEGVNIQQVSGARKAFTMLMTGEVDYMLTSPYALEAEARRFKMNHEITVAEFLPLEPELFFVFSSVTSCVRLKKQFAEAIEKNNLSRETLDKSVRAYIDDWGLRFADEPSLREELFPPEGSVAEDSATPEEALDLQEQETWD